MGQRIEIRNFRQITHADIDITNILVLIGEQATGKSTIAKLIYFFKGLGFRFIFSLDVDSKISIDLDNFIKLNNELIKMAQYDFIQYFGELDRNFRIEFWDDQKYFKVFISSDDKLIVETNFIEEIEFESFNSLIQKVKEEMKVNPKRKLHSGDIFRWSSTVFRNIFSCDYFPAGRAIAINFPESVRNDFIREVTKNKHTLNSEGEINLNIYDSYFSISSSLKEGNNKIKNEQLAQIVENKFMSIFKGTYMLDLEKEEKILLNNGTEIYLKNASSGQQESIRLIQDIIATINSELQENKIYEEPEAHLYPLAIKSLIELMVLMVNKTNSQIIITTHSPYILSVFNLLMYAYRVNENTPREIDNLIDKHGEKKMPKEILLDPSKFKAYNLEMKDDGVTAHCINDSESKLINEDALDNISIELAELFSELQEINSSKV